MFLLQFPVGVLSKKQAAAGMALVQSKGNFLGSAGVALTVGSGQGWASTGAGNLIVVMIYASGGTITITDGGDVFSNDSGASTAGTYGTYYICSGAGGKTTISAAFLSGDAVMIASEFSGITGCALDVTGSQNYNGGATSYSSDPVSTTAIDLWTGMSLDVDGTSTVIIPGNGLSIASAVADTTQSFRLTKTYILNAAINAGAVNSGTFTGGVSHRDRASISVFK